jgi:hypothetical protein
MSHACIAGITESGKTHLARALARGFMRSWVKTLVLHKPLEKWGRDEAAWQTSDPEAFLRMFDAARGCAVFMELADADVSKWDDRFHKAFSRGRHLGHRCHFLAQRAAMVHPAIRENCTAVYLFKSAPKGAQVWAEEFADDQLLKAGETTFPQYHFMHKASRFAQAVQRKLSN